MRRCLADGEIDLICHDASIDSQFLARAFAARRSHSIVALLTISLFQRLRRALLVGSPPCGDGFAARSGRQAASGAFAYARSPSQPRPWRRPDAATFRWSVDHFGARSMPISSPPLFYHAAPFCLSILTPAFRASMARNMLPGTAHGATGSRRARRHWRARAELNERRGAAILQHL